MSAPVAARRPAVRRAVAGEPAAREALRQVVKEDVDDRRGVEREHLAQQQAADHADAQRPAKLGADAGADGQRDAAQQRGHGGHHDGTEAQQAGFVDGVGGVLAVLAFAFQREVHHHDAVLLHDADEQDDADDGHHAQILVEQHERQQRAHAGRGQGGKNRDGVNEAFVQHAEHDVDRDQRGQDQQRLVGQRVLERGGRALEAGLQAGRHVHLLLHLVDGGRWRCPARRCGARLKETVTEGNCPW